MQTQIIISVNSTKYFIDTFDAVAIKLNYSIKDIREIDKRTSNYSLTISLPGTQSNNLIFNNIFEVNNITTFNPAIKAPVTVFQDSIPVISGYLQLTGIKILDGGQIEYECVIYGEIADLSKTIGDYYIVGNDDITKDLSFAELDHKQTVSNITNSWSGNSDTIGYVYPVIDYGYGWTANTLANPNNNIVLECPGNLFPCIYVKRIIDKIFKSAGFTYTSTFFDSDFFKKIFITGKQDHFQNISVIAYTDSAIKKMANGTFLKDLLNFNPTAKYGYDPNNLITQESDSVIYASPINGYLCFGSGEYNLSYVLNVSVLSTATSPAFTHELIYDNVGVLTVLPDVNGDLSKSYSVDNVVYFNRNYNLTDGIVYFHRIGWIDVDATVNIGSQLTVTNSKKTDLSIFLPDKIKQIDFIMSIVKMFNLYLEYDKDNSKNIIIETRKDYFASGAIKDWSAKIDVASNYELTPLPEIATKTYDFLYEADSDFLNTNYLQRHKENYGEFKYIINNDFVTGVTEIKPIFASTLISLVNGYTNFVIPRIYKTSNTVAEEVMSTIKPRILLNSGIISTGDTTITLQGVDGQSEVNGYPYTAMYEIPSLLGISSDVANSLLFGNIIPDDNINDGTLKNNLFDKYYADELTGITDINAKLLKANFYLNSLDIYNLRFNDKIFLNLENNPAYYRINKITDYDASVIGLTIVELILMDDIYLNPITTPVKVKKISKFNDQTNNINIGANVILDSHNVVVGTGNVVNSNNNNVVGAFNFVDVNSNNNNINGVGNIVNGQNIVINGDSNTVKGGVNNQIIGSNNTIEAGTNYVVVVGTGIDANANNTIYSSNINVDGYVIDSTKAATWDAKLDSVMGVANRIIISGINNNIIDIASNYVGQNTITTLGTIATGTWQGTQVADAYISSAATWSAKENALTFINGVTRATNTITNDLITGKAGGQTIYGGINASDSITIHSTSHATKGIIQIGAANPILIVPSGSTQIIKIGTTNTSTSSDTCIIQNVSGVARSLFILDSSGNGVLNVGNGGEVTFSSNKGNSSSIGILEIIGTKGTSSQTTLAKVINVNNSWNAVFSSNDTIASVYISPTYTSGLGGSRTGISDMGVYVTKTGVPSATNSFNYAFYADVTYSGSGNKAYSFYAKNGIVGLNDGVNIELNTTTGSKIGTSTSHKLGFWGTTPIVQPTTAYGSAGYAAGAGAPVTTLDTYDGYTMAQIVSALRGIGLLA